LLFYGINDPSCPNGGDTVSTTGTLAVTLNNIPIGTNIYVQLTDSSEFAIAQCGQETTNSYCTTYGCSTYGTSVGYANFDISVKGDPLQSC
jgi:hypothetical protein